MSFAKATLILETGHSFEGEIIADTVYSARGMVAPSKGITHLNKDPSKLQEALLNGEKWKKASGFFGKRKK